MHKSAPRVAQIAFVCATAFAPALLWGNCVELQKKATPWWKKIKSWLRLWCVALGKMATGQLTLQNRQLVCGKCVQRRLVCGVQMYFVLAKFGTRGAKLAILSASVRNACNVLRLHPSEL